jgi:hypothetical protein
VSGAISMTSEQLSERLERAGRSAVNGLWKELGFESMDAFKAALKPSSQPPAKTEPPADNSEELKKAKDQLTQAEQRALTAESARLNSEKKSEALSLMAGRFIDPRAAIKLLDLNAIKQDAEGKFTGLAEAIAQLEKDAPWALVQAGTKRPGMPPIGATNPPGGKPVGETDAEKHDRYFGGKTGNGFFTGGKVTLPK